MTSTWMHDLTFSLLDDGTIRLEQIGGGDETVLIDLHVSQLRLIAEHVGLMRAPDPCAEALLCENAKLARRLARLDEMIRDFVLADYYRGEILDSCGSGLEIIAVLDALQVIANEFAADVSTECGREDGAVSLRGAETPLDMPTPRPVAINASESVPAQLPLTKLE